MSRRRTAEEVMWTLIASDWTHLERDFGSEMRDGEIERRT